MNSYDVHKSDIVERLSDYPTALFKLEENGSDSPAACAP